MNDEAVTRLYRCLVEELRRRGHAEDDPVTVAELHQDLVPYRAVRSALGVDLMADYEHALLRLLAGERGLLHVEPAEAREALRREVEVPYPVVGLYRKFSACEVQVSMNEPATGEQLELEPGRPAAQPAARPAPGSPSRAAAADRRSARPARPARPARRGGAAPLSAPTPVQIHRDAPDADPTERLTHAGAECVFCGEDLPTGRRVRFCPRCGGDRRLRPCPRCNAVLEREWRYCISCGHDVAEGGS
ncbi:MAG TPA: zinc ribbon domain-containing protein [Longimicrobiales bacterium]|nr:zinc ribbon domain-containing protein [Longimicrobiales bacterium]